MRRLGWLGLGLLVFTLAAGPAAPMADGFWPTPIYDMAPSPGDPPPTRYGADDVIGVGEVTYRLTRFVVADRLGDRPAAKASDGGVLIAVEYEMRNISWTQINPADEPPMFLVDPEGIIYRPDPRLTANVKAAFAEYRDVPALLSPGVGVKVIIVFEVGKDRFDLDTWVLGVGQSILIRLPARSADDGVQRLD